MRFDLSFPDASKKSWPVTQIVNSFESSANDLRRLAGRTNNVSSAFIDSIQQHTLEMSKWIYDIRPSNTHAANIGLCPEVRNRLDEISTLCMLIVEADNPTETLWDPRVYPHKPNSNQSSKKPKKINRKKWPQEDEKFSRFDRAKFPSLLDPSPSIKIQDSTQVEERYPTISRVKEVQVLLDNEDEINDENPQLIEICKESFIKNLITQGDLTKIF